MTPNLRNFFEALLKALLALLGGMAGAQWCDMERTSAMFLLAFGAVMCAISLALPPTGEIDGSVLMLFGQILVYAGSVFGVRIYIKDLMNQHKKPPQ